MSFPRYESCTSSGIEWLGELPRHWEVKRIKHTTYLKGRVGWKGLTSDEYLDDGYAYLVTGTDFGGKFIEWSQCHCVDRLRYEDDPFIQLRDGDLLITKDGTIGKLALVAGLDRPACLTVEYF
jgi:type I restriction enzyme S subunit